MLRRFSQQLPRTLQRTQRFLTVLAFESSADDSCVAIVNSDRAILANVVIEQDGLNASFGGIQPMVALDAHQQHMPVALQMALDDAKMSVRDVDGIAFTRGPGMSGCLSVGMNAAKILAAAYNKPFVGVHHMEAHALTPLLTQPADAIPRFPFLSLLVTGGHTLLVLVRSHSDFKTIATTGDESIGRGLDKVARTLGLPPRGAALEAFCAEADDPNVNTDDIDIGRPLSNPLPHQLAFSFSGIRSQFDRNVEFVEQRFGAQKPAFQPVVGFPGPHVPLPPRQGGPLQDESLTLEHLAARRKLGRTYQDAAFAHLADKVRLGLRLCQMNGEFIHALVVSGGVGSNMALRKRLRSALLDYGSPIPMLCPPPRLCTDNAAMIAWASMYRFRSGDHDDFSIRLKPQWPFEVLTPSQERPTPGQASQAWPE